MTAEPRKDKENDGSDGEAPEGDGVRADGDEFHDQAAEAEDDAAEEQQRRRMAVGRRGHEDSWVMRLPGDVDRILTVEQSRIRHFAAGDFCVQRVQFGVEIEQFAVNARSRDGGEA